MLFSKFQKEVLPILPTSPGVYLMKNQEGTIIYIGKAKNIKNRVSSYFHGKKEIKTALLVQAIETIDFFLTNSEQDALLLENNLIKKHKPKYNINLKDGKTYPFLKISKESFPRVYKTRTVIANDGTYYGPFTDVKKLDKYICLINKIYPLRRCKGSLKNKKACLYFHLKQCSGPCIGAISQEEYKTIINEIEKLTNGEDEFVIKSLKEKMEIASTNMEFEKAIEYRDAINAIYSIKQPQEMVSFNNEIRDYISYLYEEELLIFSVLQMREGKMCGKDTIVIENCFNIEEATCQFLVQYYQQYHEPPQMLFFDTPIEIGETITFLQNQHNCTISHIEKLTKSDISILNLALENCRHEMLRQKRFLGDMPALVALQQALHLKEKPIHIEGFDIAHLGGKYTVSSLIVFKNGRPDKESYRSFNIRLPQGTIDDYESIREAVARRYTRLKNENLPLPNLILIDGGEGQVNAAAQILEILDLSIPIVGLAKKEEWLFLPNQKEPIILPKGNDALRILQAVRDETHRVATTKSRKQQLKELEFSSFKSIHGIGAMRSLILMKQYGSIAEIAKQNPLKLHQECNISLPLAKAVIKEAQSIQES